MKTTFLILASAAAICLMLPVDASAAKGGGGGGAGGRAGVAHAGAVHVGGAGGSWNGGNYNHNGYYHNGYYHNGYGGFYPGFGIGLGLGLGYGYGGYGYGYPIYGSYYYAQPYDALYSPYTVPPGYPGVFPDPNINPPNGPAPAPGTLPPPKDFMPKAGTVRLEVNVPNPQAKVWVDGQPTTSTGTDRVFVTSPLEMGYSYTYTMRATWNDAGHEVAVERQVEVTPGQATRVDFTRDVARANPPPALPPPE